VLHTGREWSEERTIEIEVKTYNMNSDKANSRTELGFSFRRLALVLLALIAFRGAIGGIREFVTDGNWLAGILGVIIVSIIAYWLFNLYHSEE